MFSFLKRKKNDEPVVEDDDKGFSGFNLPDPATEPEPSEDEGTSLSVTNPAEAKLAIKQLKMRQKELRLQKRQVQAELTELKTKRRQRVASQGSTMRGGGDFGKMVRGIERMGRDSARSAHANAISPYEQQKANIEAQIHNLDVIILNLEQFILEHED